MRLAAITLAVATVLVASGCNRIGGGADAGKAASLDFDKPVSGEITSRSGINYNDGSHHQLYQIKLEDKQLVGLKLTGSLSGSIAVFNNGSLVASSNSGYEREGDVSVAFRANGGGTYQVAVNANGSTDYGPYRLRAEKLVPYDGKPLAGSGEIVDMLAGGSQDYTLQVDKAGLYEIRLVSDVFDPVLKLSGQGVDAENDDGGDSTNSRLTLSLKPGKYTLTARGLGDGLIVDGVAQPLDRPGLQLQGHVDDQGLQPPLFVVIDPDPGLDLQPAHEDAQPLETQRLVRRKRRHRRRLNHAAYSWMSGVRQARCWPPSTAIIWPVTIRASISHSTASATARGAAVPPGHQRL